MYFYLTDAYLRERGKKSCMKWMTAKNQIKKWEEKKKEEMISSLLNWFLLYFREMACTNLIK